MRQQFFIKSHKATLTLRQEIVKSLKKTVVNVGLAVATFTVVSHFATPSITIQPSDTKSPVAVAPVDGRQVLLDGLIRDNGCWGDDALDAPIPNKVVYSVGDGEPKVGGPEVTGKALEQVFDGSDHGLVVYAFCS